MLMTEEPVAVIAEEREMAEDAEATVLVIDVRRVRVRVRHESMLVMNLDEATEIRILTIEQTVNGSAHRANNPPRRVEVAVPLREVTAHRAIEPRGIAEVHQENAIGLVWCVGLHVAIIS